jgi:RNA polymerase sigma-70 factor (ECF subfamily)
LGLRTIHRAVPRLDPTSLTEHIDALYRAAWALCGSREDAEDLVQDTFTRVLSRPRRIKTGGERAYLMSALRNTFFSRLRTAARRPRTVPPPETETAAQSQPSLQPERAAETAEILEAVARLPEDFRLALTAVDILGLSYAEAAAALDTREATITTRLYRARQRIAQEFADPPATRASGEPGDPKANATAQEGNGRNRSLA